jgi:hypothetical protein
MSFWENNRLGRITVMMFLFGAGCATSTGCMTLRAWNSRGWVADYDTAERRVLETGRDMLIWYLDPRPGKARGVEEILDAATIKSRTRGYVRCRLFKTYEPDRRYVGQFGVERAPALIVVHTDGTYHAMTGPMSVDTVYNFLGDAVAPGEVVAANRQIPRRAMYNWHRDAPSAREASESAGAPILFVFHRRLSRDWQRLEKLLSRQEVYERFRDMVHCRLGPLKPWAKVHHTEFGALSLPALVIAHPDGTHHVLEMPTSYEAVVRFADGCGDSSTAARARSAARVVQP